MKLGFLKKKQTEPKKEDTAPKNPIISKISTRASKYLLHPVVSEKASVLGKYRKYVFAVSMESNKVEIAKAVKELYDITPTKVQVLHVKPKQVRFGKFVGKRKEWKKAIVTLPEGKSLNLYEGV